MAESYTPHSLPILGTNDLIRSPTDDNIRKQINAVATAADTAITAEGARAEGAANDYTDSKDTSNRSAWAAGDTATLNSAKSYADGKFIPAWKASTAYTAGKLVIAPSGEVVAAKNDHTSGPSFNSANWNSLPLRLVPNGADVSTWKTSAYNGQWLINGSTQASSILGLPPQLALPLGILTHRASDNGMFFQEFRAYGAGVSGSFSHENVAFNSGTWTAWRKNLSSDDTAGTILGAVNLSTVTTPGRYYPGNGSSVTEANGYPPGAAGLVGPLTVENWTNTTAVNRIQTYKPWASNTFYIRHIYNGTPEASWAAYEDAATLRAYTDSKSVADPGIHQHTMRLNDLKRRLAPISTGGKGAVALVFDHGTNNMKNIIPMLQARGLRATLALNSDMYNTADSRYTTNNLTTWSEIQGWHDAGTIEVANHGRKHLGCTTRADIYNEIVGGRDDLEANMPGVKIDSWVQIGAGAGSNNGFSDGSTLAAYYTTDAGRIILDGHAVATGSLPGTRLLPLAGEPIIGASGSWIDTGQADIDAVESAITSAGTQKRGFMVRFHPQYLDQSGYITTAQFTAFLDWLAARTDVVVLPLREMAIATV